MQLEFEKNNIRCLRYVLREVKDHEETQELRLEDGMPDIGAVLCCWGQVVVRGKEWRSSGININGGINAWVLYKPEDGDSVYCAETWIPYQFKCDFEENERDGGIVIQPLLRSIDARMISSRKMLIRADISALCEAMVDTEIAYYKPAILPEDIMLLQETFNPLLPKETNEKAFMIDDTVSLPIPLERIQKIIYFQLVPSVTEYKVMGDKIIFRGQSKLHVLYMDLDGRLLTWDEEIPFSQFAELGREYSDSAIANVIMAVTSAELDRGDVNYRLRAGLTGQYVVYDEEKVTVVKDAYSPKNLVKVHTDPLTLPSILDVRQNKISADCKLSDEYADVVDVVLYPEHPCVYRDDDTVMMEYSGAFHALCQSIDGELGSQILQFNTKIDETADMLAKPMTVISNASVPQIMTSGSTLLLSANLDAMCMWTTGRAVNMITALEIGDAIESAGERPGVILCRAGGATLWEIAKKYGSTVELIMQANKLQGEADGDRMLLVPMV